MEETTEEKIWEIWIHKDVEESFEDFRKKSRTRRKPKTLSKKEEDEIMKQAEDILNMQIEREVSN